MSEQLAWFETPSQVNAVFLPVPFEAMIDGWAKVRKAMIRNVAEGFTRDEWAYLATFLEGENLRRPFMDAFGQPAAKARSKPGRIYRPRGPIAVWLPSNVSLLGPLTLVLLSLTGARQQLKLGSAGDDLAGAFLAFARDCKDLGPLGDYLESAIEAVSFRRGDPRERAMASEAKVRIVFGGDEAAAAIHALPHPVDSRGISFADRQSEAWLSPSAADDECLKTLIRVFAVYGQAGCTSPRRVVLLDGSRDDSEAIADRLLHLADGMIREQPAMHVASENLMAAQWASALGWRATCLPGQRAVIASGAGDLEDFTATMALKVQSRTLDEAFVALPDNIQTIGHALEGSLEPEMLERLARSRIARFVPIAKMHHFASTWDGENFWADCFEAMEIQA